MAIPNIETLHSTILVLWTLWGTAPNPLGLKPQTMYRLMLALAPRPGAAVLRQLVSRPPIMQQHPRPRNIGVPQNLDLSFGSGV